MKAEPIFGLENASWPALLVDAHGTIRASSQGTSAVFGSILASSYLSSIWAPGNELPAEQFMAKLPRSVLTQARLLFRTKGGASAEFNVFITYYNKDAQRFYVFQLLPEAPAVEDKATPPPAKPQNVEIITQKQKLDCALQLTRTVALDFNNALTSILAHTSHILDQIEPGHPWRSSLVEAEKAAEKAAEIASDLAAFSRQEKDQKAQPAGNFNTILRRAIELFQKAGPSASNIDWQTHFESRPYAVSFDEAKMHQAVVKILENSIQAVGKNRSRITVSSRNLELSQPTKDQNVNLPAGSYVCVEIQDDGPGIPPTDLPRVFEPFFTTKYGHRGLGLAWVYGIVTNHGGSVAISSTVDVGTSVRLYLPATRKLAKDSFQQKEDLRGTETILMVDDEDLLLNMGQIVLSSFGYNVLTANGGEQAIDIVTKSDKPIHLVITDLVMPKMGGRELIENIRKISPATRIIHTSGYVRPAAEEDEAFLQKPFTSKELLNKVRHILNAEK